jgi:predicted transcriptional regulator
MPTISDITGGIGKFFKKNKGSYTLTQQGKIKSDNWNSNEASYRYDILVYLDDNSPATVREISEKLHIPEKVVTHLLDEFEEDGWVMKK